MSDNDDEQYYARVEQHFGRRRGGPLVLSPADWRLLEGWRAQGVPLRVVLRGINQAFDRFQASGPRPDRINSLRYCEQEVQAAWEQHRALHRRRDDDDGDSGLPAASRHLAGVAAACREAGEAQEGGIRAVLEETAAAVDELCVAARSKTMPARELDRRAGELEAELLAQANEIDAETAARLQETLPRFSPYEAS